MITNSNDLSAYLLAGMASQLRTLSYEIDSIARGFSNDEITDTIHKATKLFADTIAELRLKLNAGWNDKIEVS